jgi:hypothetical protein
MHVGEAGVPDGVARRLAAGQFPQWRDWYYAGSNPAVSASGRRALRRLLASGGESGG